MYSFTKRTLYGDIPSDPARGYLVSDEFGMLQGFVDRCDDDPAKWRGYRLGQRTPGSYATRKDAADALKLIQARPAWLGASID